MITVAFLGLTEMAEELQPYFIYISNKECFVVLNLKLVHLLQFTSI